MAAIRCDPLLGARWYGDTRRRPAVTYTRARNMIEQFQKTGLGSNRPEYYQVTFARMQQ
jgi:hypothetical protein